MKLVPLGVVAEWMGRRRHSGRDLVDEGLSVLRVPTPRGHQLRVSWPAIWAFVRARGEGGSPPSEEAVRREFEAFVAERQRRKGVRA